MCNPTGSVMAEKVCLAPGNLKLKTKRLGLVFHLVEKRSTWEEPQGQNRNLVISWLSDHSVDREWSWRKSR